MFEFKHPKYYKNLRNYIDRAIGTRLLVYKLRRQTQDVRLGPAKCCLIPRWLSKEPQALPVGIRSAQALKQGGGWARRAQAYKLVLRRQAVRESTSVEYDPNHRGPQASSRGSLQADRESLNSHKVLWSQDRRLGL